MDHVASTTLLGGTGGGGVQVDIALAVLHKGDLFLEFAFAACWGGIVLGDVTQS